jgi:hypothetical protein
MDELYALKALFAINAIQRRNTAFGAPSGPLLLMGMVQYCILLQYPTQGYGIGIG